jgi:hypothetical protein
MNSVLVAEQLTLSQRTALLVGRLSIAADGNCLPHTLLAIPITVLKEV